MWGWELEGERKLLFTRKEVFALPPSPPLTFKKNGVLLRPPVFGCVATLRRGKPVGRPGYVARGRSADTPPWHAGRDKPLDAARGVFVLLNKRGVF